jgi:hypothetical protein
VRIVKYEVTAYIPNRCGEPRLGAIVKALNREFMDDDGTGVEIWQVTKLEERHVKDE